MMLHLMLVLLLAFPLAPNWGLWFPPFELTIQEQPPQAFAVHGGIIYVLDPQGMLYITRKGRTETIPLSGAQQAGSLEIDGDDLVIMRNMRPLDEARDILRFDKRGNLLEKTVISLDKTMQRRVDLPQGEAYIFPQTVKAGVVEDGYLIENSDGRRWLFKPGGDGVAYPNYSYSADQNRLELYFRTSHITVNTTGTAVNVRYLGRDQQGREYWCFTDFYDAGNQRRIVLRIGKRGLTYTDITNKASFHLNTWVSLDSETGHIYTAAASADKYRIHRVTRGFTRKYPTWKPHSVDVDHSPIPREPNPGLQKTTRSQVWETALAYVNHQWVLDIESNGSDPANEVIGLLPRWFDLVQDGETVRGLPYCWGGSVTLDMFMSHLSSGWQAGNIDPQGDWKKGTTGVDCSGFIWNCYGYPTRPGGGRTSITSPLYWTKIPGDDLVWMDMVRKPGHVVLFILREPHNPDLFYTIEATAAFGNDRVMMWYRFFSQGFQGFRYNGLYQPH